MNKSQILNLFIITFVILVISHTKAEVDTTTPAAAGDTTTPAAAGDTTTPDAGGDTTTPDAGGISTTPASAPETTETTESPFDSDGIKLKPYEVANLKPADASAKRNGVILFQLIRPPQEGKSILKELLFMPPIFYEKPYIEEGYTYYAICHSKFDLNKAADGAAAPAADTAAADTSAAAKPAGADGTGGNEWIDPAFDKLGDDCEGILQVRNKEVTFIYGKNSHQSKSLPFCDTRHRYDVFEKDEFQSACNARIYAVGLNISGTIITFAESCFDILRNKVHYIHYLNKPVNPVPHSYIMPDFADENDELSLHAWDFKEKKYRKLKRSIDNMSYTNQTFRKSKRALYVIFNTTIEKNPYKKAFLPEQYFRRVKIDIDSVLRKNIGEQADFLKFSEANLFPHVTFAPYITNPFENLEFLQSFIGWENLVYGNWHLFNDLLERRIFELADHKVSYNIYAGTSHIAEAVLPDCDDLKELGVREYGKLKPIPKYVWMYLNSKETNEDFVVIGINTPYNPFFQTSDIFFCNDMCDQIEWMKPLEIMRKINTFGRLFCCERSQSEGLLNHFPVRPTLTSSE